MGNIIEIIQWAEEYLLSQGYTINGPSEDVQTTPWSSVKRFMTLEGYIYLKQTPPALSLEPIITQILHDQFHASVPLVIATNKKLNCFLMKDAGIPLRELLKSSFQPHLLCQAIKQYTAMQCAATKNINTFLELGVPDWRLGVLPTLYTQIIRKENLLTGDGLTTDELNVLHQLQPKLLTICGLLASYKVPETLDHCDFHDNNILIKDDSKTIAITDLGETVITHPFFSLITCLRNASLRYSLKKTDKIYLELQEASFENWLKFEIRKNLSKIFSLAEKLWPIYAALGEYRLMMSSNKEEFKLLNRRGRLAMGFKEFISICEKEIE